MTTRLMRVCFEEPHRIGGEHHHYLMVQEINGKRRDSYYIRASCFIDSKDLCEERARLSQEPPWVDMNFMPFDPFAPPPAWLYRIGKALTEEKDTFLRERFDESSMDIADRCKQLAKEGKVEEAEFLSHCQWGVWRDCPDLLPDTLAPFTVSPSRRHDGSIRDDNHWTVDRESTGKSIGEFWWGNGTFYRWCSHWLPCNVYWGMPTGMEMSSAIAELILSWYTGSVPWEKEWLESLNKLDSNNQKV